jgi:hypothetical protein
VQIPVEAAIAGEGVGAVGEQNDGGFGFRFEAHEGWLAQVPDGNQRFSGSILETTALMASEGTKQRS